MECCAGLDVSLELTSVCIMDRDGKVLREAKVATDPRELSRYLQGAGVALKRVGLEAGATTQWLYGGLAKAGLPVICIETLERTASCPPAVISRLHRNTRLGESPWRRAT